MALSQHFSERSWLILAQFMHPDPGLTSQYFSINFNSLLNLNHFTQNLEVSVLFPVVITIVEPLPLPDSWHFSNRASLISQRGCVLSFISVDDSISRRSSSIFPFPKYRAKDIPWTLSLSYSFRGSIPITFPSTNFAAQMHIGMIPN